MALDRTAAIRAVAEHPPPSATSMVPSHLCQALCLCLVLEPLLVGAADCATVSMAL